MRFNALEMRPCYITTYKREPERRVRLVKDGEVKALFHCWVHKSEIVPPSAMMGGHNGGVISGVVGLVETEGGRLREVSPSDIRFVDNPFADFDFREEATDDASD